jgi:hypothetical protein
VFASHARLLEVVILASFGWLLEVRKRCASLGRLLEIETDPVVMGGDGS